MELRSIMFGELDSVDKITMASWASLIPANLHCKLGTYTECEEVGDVNNGLVGIDYSMPIGFVLRGK